MSTDDLGLDEQDWQVLALYGRAMLSAQILEFSIFDLAQWDRPTPRDADRALRQVEGLLKQPKRDQVKGLSGLADELRGDLLLALDTRNTLSHSFLTEYRIDAAVLPSAAEKVKVRLANMTEFFDQVSAKLDYLSSQHMEEAGIVVNEEDTEAVRDSLRKYVDEKYEGE